MTIQHLKAPDLYHHCEMDQFEFETTADLEDLTEVIGQDRAVEAVRFGIGIQRAGYNLFALGPNGIGKYSLVRRSVEDKAVSEAVPSDWCYVNNFQQPHIPLALELPPGRGKVLSRDMEQLIEDLHGALPAVVRE